MTAVHQPATTGELGTDIICLPERGSSEVERKARQMQGSSVSQPPVCPHGESHLDARRGASSTAEARVADHAHIRLTDGDQFDQPSIRANPDLRLFV